MERTHHSGLIEPHYFARCNRGDRRKAAPMTVQAALTKEIPRLMPFSETTITLHLPSMM